ncbi:MAG: nucleotidyl transferase AbiEii/AbiGii toxin family protein [Candidatus Omnitrophica bacterium CG02_land_8_20_14_3_00__42_8]|nr:MAG: nucleotidyl transferase AbiEii/AbiGii toxin family protein [Candidatus Omnitrophica bacterium CG02_land_8_20_14_3_00__42_8]
MIESRNLYRIQSGLTKGNKTIPIKTIEKDYVLSWILIGIAMSGMQDVMSFKGGTALKKVYFHDYRFSEDLDFTLLNSLSIDDITGMLESVYSIVLDASNIKLILSSKEIYANGYTFFVNFSGPLGADITRGEIKIDFTINEKLINRPVVKTLLREYDEYTDMPEGDKLKVYPLAEIFIEKYISILDKSRNEPRDIYDLWYLVSNECVEIAFLGRGIKEKGMYKGLKNFDIIEMLDRKENNYNKLWDARLSNHMINLPYFNKVYRELKKYLKPLNKLIMAQGLNL